MTREKIRIKIINVEPRIYKMSQYVTKFTLSDENNIEYKWYAHSSNLSYIKLNEEYVVTMTKAINKNRNGELEVFRVNFK